MVTAPSSNLAQLTESLKLEHQFVRVPFEHYKKTIRVNHRAVEKEISSVVSSVNEAADSDLSRDDAVQHLSSLVSRLHGLKRKVNLNLICIISLGYELHSFFFSL
ncbi:Protein MAEA homolog [Linum perenne]